MSQNHQSADAANDNDQPISFADPRLENKDTRDVESYREQYRQKDELPPYALHDGENTVELKNPVPELGVEQSALVAGVKVQLTLLPDETLRVRKFMEFDGTMYGDEREITKDEKHLYGALKGLYELYQEQQGPFSAIRSQVHDALNKGKTGTNG